jgi:hypothetical protein
MKQDLVTRLQTRVQLRQGVISRKTLRGQKLDRITDLLQEASAEIVELRRLHKLWLDATIQLIEAVSKDD